MYLCRVQRQQRALVLQEHNAFRRALQGHGPLFRCIHFASGLVGMVEQAALKDHEQNAAYVVVERSFGDVAGLDLGQHFVGYQPSVAIAGGLHALADQPGNHWRTAGHFQVHPRIHGGRG